MKNVDYQLRQFVKAARHKSLSDAAATLRVTQSALSKQVREIETAVGHPMFRRHGRGVELTEQGEALWLVAQTAYKLVDTTISGLQAERPGLRVASIPGLTELAIRELLSELMGQKLDTGLTTMEAAGDEVSRLVEAGAVDVGFVDRSVPLPDTLTAAVLSGERYEMTNGACLQAPSHGGTVTDENVAPDDRGARPPMDQRDTSSSGCDRTLIAVTRKHGSKLTRFRGQS